MRALIFVLIPLTVFSLSHAADTKSNVCSMTINSDNEIKLFKKNLPADMFNFTELLPTNPSSDWFDTACKSNIKCDVLVISGHFAGSFYNVKDKRKVLSLLDLEKKSCDNSCPGILSNPKQVFLFGCNTLAGKGINLDRRTRDEYYTEIRPHGLDPLKADRAAESVYEDHSFAFNEEVKLIFNQTPSLIGFTAKGPSGATIEPYLQKALDELKNPQFLGDLNSERAIQLTDQGLVNLNAINNPSAAATRAPASIELQKVLKSKLKITAYTYCNPKEYGLSEINIKTRERLCSLLNDNLSDDTKANAIENIFLEDQENTLNKFLPSLYQFLVTHPEFKLNSSIINKLSENAILQERIAQLYESYKNDSNSSILQTIYTLNRLGLITDEDSKVRFQNILNQNADKLNQDGVDIICGLKAEGLNFPKLATQDLNKFKKDDSILSQILACINK